MATTIQLSVETIRRNAVQKRDIALLQSLLAARGLLGCEIDGVFGPVTEKAVLYCGRPGSRPFRAAIE